MAEVHGHWVGHDHEEEDLEDEDPYGDEEEDYGDEEDEELAVMHFRDGHGARRDRG